MIAGAETYRIATFAAPLSRDGPGLLLRDLLKGEDAQIAAIASVIDHVDPDILVLTDFDYDLEGRALTAFAAQFGDRYPHRFARRPNTGMATGLDLDQNGRTGEARDAQGYGRFAGDGGMAILSAWAIDAAAMVDHSTLLWRDLPDASFPRTVEGEPFLPKEEQAIQRLSHAGHWIVPIDLQGDGHVNILAFAATPPVFDGPEDRNGLRNRDELRLWEVVLDGGFGPPPERFVVAGNANLDPLAGDGLSDAMAAFLARPDLQDPLPSLPTADWADDGPGDLRVSYVLPSTDWRVVDAGVFWPAPDAADATLLGEDGLSAGVHHLVWVDITRQSR
ncbi:endonuclease/exonuclease/phosphatase family protein [Cognatiyoonia sp. IB215182]|uniref:endonuclease/exonuclease/phosphatase family protein n=1 Tax=Cognatiyoonia sp. IB215182 TaxID=3097353 RepID=UPI002A13127E|nr:endonuclease/exonuclease/phosphatase family protein [Cognatiyoonia sp. IB215182]MDX8351670.1 endonuclease/exonuclease/phosphatase family protein [Cognatiyoonia sp. IB215182]